MCPSFGLWASLGLWFPVYHRESTIVRQAPPLTLCEHVFFFTSPHTCTLCPMFVLDPSVVGPWTCLWKDTIKSLNLLVERHNQLIARFAYPCHVIGEEFAFLFFLYIKLFQLGVKVAFNNRSTVTHHADNSITLFGAAALTLLSMLWCCLFASALFNSRNPSSLSVDRLNSKICSICRLIATVTPSGACPRQDLRRKTLSRSWKIMLAQLARTLTEWHYNSYTDLMDEMELWDWNVANKDFWSWFAKSLQSQ